LVYTNFGWDLMARRRPGELQPTRAGRQASSIVEEKFVDIVIPDDERPTGRLVSSCSGPAGHRGSRAYNPGFPTVQTRTSGVIESGGSC
jgi:hypothetical protein